MKSVYRIALSVFALFVVAGSDASTAELWLLVDTQERTLSVMQDERVRQTYEDIAIGRGGVTRDKIRNDEKTPLGEFHIVRVAEDSPFHRFYAFDYPSLEHAGRALEAGVINQRQFSAIRQTLGAGGIPPQETALGGYLGIHGIGRGDPAIHAEFNWTSGCVAVSNEQIDDLDQWIFFGMRVIVR